MAGAFTLPKEYWTKIQITPQEIEHLQAYLFECETPLSTRDLSRTLVEFRIKNERAASENKQNADSRTYFPKEKYQQGDRLVFSALGWQHGQVTAVRAGLNPSENDFDVLTVALEDGSERFFAANLAAHTLNDGPSEPPQDDDLNPELIVREHGDVIESRLEDAFSQDDGLVRIAGRWFPRALLIDLNQGQLNLAEAVLDM